MILSYTDYINQFMPTSGKNSVPSPGEHHFIATYLLPKVVAVTGQVPDYVNPDGMKRLTGDIVYWKDGKHHFGIEVKYETISMTKNEYNNWIVKDDKSKPKCPAMFIGVCTNGVIVLTWDKFRSVYLNSINSNGKNEICERYAKSKSINVLFEEGGGGDGYFQRGTNENEAKDNEVKFIKYLCDQLPTAR